MAVDVPGKGEERNSSGGLELGREERREVRRDKMGERGDNMAMVRFLNLSGSRPCGCIDFFGR